MVCSNTVNNISNVVNDTTITNDQRYQRIKEIIDSYNTTNNVSNSGNGNGNGNGGNGRHGGNIRTRRQLTGKVTLHSDNSWTYELGPDDDRNAQLSAWLQDTINRVVDSWSVEAGEDALGSSTGGGDLVPIISDDFSTQ